MDPRSQIQVIHSFFENVHHNVENHYVEQQHAVFVAELDVH